MNVLISARTAAVVSILLVAAACGGDSSDSEGEPPTPEGVSKVTVTWDGGSWAADPAGPVVFNPDGVEIVVRNGGTDSVKPVILWVIGVDPSSLPPIDTDLCRGGPPGMEEGVTEVGCVEPGVPEEGAPFIADDLAPGDSLSEIDHRGPGSYVVLNNEPGAYEAGDYIVIDITDGN